MQSFRKSAWGKMEDVSKSEGRTIMFVSHNLAALEAVCTKAQLMERGKLVCSGSVSEVVERYRNTGMAQAEVYRSVTSRLRWKGLSNRAQLDTLMANDDLCLALEFEIGDENISDLHVDCAVVNDSGQIIVHAMSKYVTSGFRVGKGERIAVEYCIKSPKLAPGHYNLIVFAASGGDILFWGENIDACNVLGKSYFGQLPFFADLKSPIVPEFNVEVHRI